MLRIDHLAKTYGDRVVLEDLSLSVQPGEIYGLLGPNGAGKTTTINILCQLLKADRGRIQIGDRPLSEQTRPWLGVVPQENLLYRSLTCAEHLHFFARLYGLSATERSQRVHSCLEAVGLTDRAKTLAEQLSGGLQRRLSLAIALVHQPKLLILDEPTTGLDLEARYSLWDLIRQLQYQGMTILLTTHLLDEVERLCQRIGILQKGRLLVNGTLDELRQVIPAAEIALLQTPTPEAAIARAAELGWPVRHYAGDLALWLPEPLEIQQILVYLEGIAIQGMIRQPVRLEHIYLELTRSQP